MDITDVRKALWNAYKKAMATGQMDGKSSEAYVKLIFPAIYDCEDENEFLEASALTIYSYALGPSREHYFYKAVIEKQENYYTWHTKDIYAKAVEVIEGWLENFLDGV